MNNFWSKLCALLLPGVVLALVVGGLIALSISVVRGDDRVPGEWLDDNMEYGEALIEDDLEMMGLSLPATSTTNCVFQMQCTEHACEICEDVYEVCDWPNITLTDMNVRWGYDGGTHLEDTTFPPAIRLCGKCRDKYLGSYANAMTDARKQWLDKARSENRALIKANTQRIKQDEINRVRDQIDGLEKRLDALRGAK
jgi:hypothetical protein